MHHRERKRLVERGDMRSMNRTRSEIMEMKRKKGGLIASSWFLKGKTSRTMTCQPTPDRELARRLNKALNKPDNQERTLITEDGGRPAISSIREKDPFFGGGCRFQDDTCPVESGRDCATQGVLYEITCNACRDPVDPGRSNIKETRKPGGQGQYNYLGMTRCSIFRGRSQNP